MSLADELRLAENLQVRIRQRRSPLKNAAIVFLSVLLTLLVCECVARVLVYAIGPNEGKDRCYDAKLQVARAVGKSSNPTLIFTGNSIASQGIYADLIEYRLKKNGFNLDVVNLATSGSELREKLFLLRTACQSNAPRIVIFQLSQTELDKDFFVMSDASKEFEQTYIYNDLYKPPLNGFDAARIWLNKHSYLAKYSKLWCYMIQTALPAIENPEQYKGGAVHLNVKECSKNGWSAAYTFSSEKEMDMYAVAGWNSIVQKTGNLPERKWLWNFEKLQSVKTFCAERKLPLYYVWLPELSSHTTTWSYKNFTVEACLNGVRNWLGKDSSTLIDMHDSDPDVSHYQIWNHMNALGAVNTSEKLAQRLSDLPALKQFKH